VILAPTDFQAFSQATGTPYPDSPDQKAALYPVVSEWKARQQAAMTESRGPSLVTPALVALGGVGLGAAGLAAFNALRRKGLDEPTAAQIAKATEIKAQSMAANAPQVRSNGDLSRGPNPVGVRRDRSGAIAYQTGFLAPGNIRGTAESRRRSEYSNTSLWNDATYGPLLRAATSPELQQQLVDSVSLQNPDLAAQLATAIELRNSPTAGIVRPVKTEADLPDPARVPEGVAYRVADTRALLTTRRNPGGGASWVHADAAGVRARLAPDGRSAYGSISPDELGEGDTITRPDKKNRAMAQPGYLLPDESGGALLQIAPAALSPQALADGYQVAAVEGATDDTALLLDPDGTPVRFGDRGVASLLNRPIRWSDLNAPQPYGDALQRDDGNALQLFIDREDELTRGGLVTPPASSANPQSLRLRQSFGWDLIPAQPRLMADGRTVLDLPRWEERPYSGGVYIGKTVSELPRRDVQDSYAQAQPSDAGALARAAGAFNAAPDRSPTALDALAQQYSVPPREIAEAAARLRGDIALPEPSGYQAPAAHAVGGRSHSDWLTQTLSALQASPRPAEAVSTAALMSDDPATRATAARGWLGSNSEIAEALSTILSPLPATDRLSVVAEGLGNAARDFKTAIDWAASADPELAPALTGGRGMPSFDQFAKSYLRRFALGAVAEDSNAGSGRAALINLPADVSELIGTQAVATGRSPDAVINELIGSVDSPIDALWRLDGVLSNAASSNLEEPYTTGSKLAERFWDNASPGDGTGVGALKARLGATSQQAYSSQDPLAAPTARLPIAIKFGSNIKGASSSALFNPDRNAVDSIITTAVNGEPRSWNDPSVVDPTLPPSRRRGRSALELAMGEAADGRPFPINATIKNRAADLAGQIKRIRADGKAQGLTAEQRNAAVAPLEAEIQQLADTQIDQLDALREEGELLLSRANEYPVTPEGRQAFDGRGYVLDLNPATGKAQALPDSFQSLSGLDRLEGAGDDDSRELLDRSTLEDLQREGSLAAPGPAAELAAGPSAQDRVLADYGHGTRGAALNFTSLGPGADAASGAERDQAISELRRQEYGQAYQPVGGERLSTPELALRVARAHLDRAHTLTPTPVQDMVATPSTEELGQARRQHLADYITKVATPSFDRAGRQVSGWAGGDSFAGGARLAGRADANVGAYATPSDAITRAIALAARRRGGR